MSDESMVKTHKSNTVSILPYSAIYVTWQVLIHFKLINFGDVLVVDYFELNWAESLILIYENYQDMPNIL